MKITAGIFLFAFTSFFAGAQQPSSSVEEMSKSLNIGKGKTVLLDSYFNNEFKKDAAGVMQSYHYKWAEQANTGFSILGDLFQGYGVKTETLYAEPTNANLKKANIYIIVDPDNKKEAANPNYIEQKDINAIYNWVKNGGVLLLMANDSGNTELPHFNNLAHRFGIHWSDTSRNMVENNEFETGAIHIPANHPVFPSVKKVYLKGICILKLQPPAQASITEDGDIVMAVAKVGKGTVFAVGDPWLYNEYVNGKNIPDEYQNQLAAKDLIRWLIRQVK